MVPLKKYKLKLNSVEKIEVLLQELYNESCKNINQIQDEMNKIANSINLNEEALGEKAKYAKAMNDFMVSKDKAIRMKLDIAKLMTEVLKYNGNLAKTFNESEAVGNWGDLISKINDAGLDYSDEENKVEEYKLR